ncbi:MAG: hypothetical protein ACJA1F_000610 [Paracoccaceae bacterium]|jgi:hypothetical protein
MWHAVVEGADKRSMTDRPAHILADLEPLLLRAHAQGDDATLVRLYTQVADAREAGGDVDGACFYLTHAYVFALQSGAAQTDMLNLRLYQHGREPRYEFTA